MSATSQTPGAQDYAAQYAQYYGGADPYAAYGGYENYVSMYYQYYQQQQGLEAPGTSASPGLGTPGMGAPPPPSGEAPPPPPPSEGPPGTAGYSAVSLPSSLYSVGLLTIDVHVGTSASRDGVVLT